MPPTHADITDAAVIGVSDVQGEEIPKAFVVTDDPALSAERVMEFVAAIPKSSAGKIPRKQLRPAGLCEQWPATSAMIITSVISREG